MSPESVTVSRREHLGVILTKREVHGCWPEIDKGSRVYHEATGVWGVFLCAVSGLEDTTAVVRLDAGHDPAKFDRCHAARRFPWEVRGT